MRIYTSELGPTAMFEFRWMVLLRWQRLLRPVIIGRRCALLLDHHAAHPGVRRGVRGRRVELLRLEDRAIARSLPHVVRLLLLLQCCRLLW